MQLKNLIIELDEIKRCIGTETNFYLPAPNEMKNGR